MQLCPKVKPKARYNNISYTSNLKGMKLYEHIQ